MKIYTKAGDKGLTPLIGGRQVPKYHKRIEACGAVDELIAFIGLLRDMIDNPRHKELLLMIQEQLMTVTSLLAAETDDFRKSLPSLYEKDIENLEKEIDIMSDRLAPLHSFIIPGGSPVISFCHIARTVCRRAERKSVKVAGTGITDLLIMKYLNRLSDFLFMFARLISSELHIKEILWKPNL